MTETNTQNLRAKLDNISKGIETDPAFNKTKHESESRLIITQLFLNAFFLLIAGGFLFCLIYNFGAAYLNKYLELASPIKYLDIANTVSLITTTLSGGMGFVIGYYFKNKDD